MHNFATYSNTEQPEKLDMLLETLSDSDIQLLNSTVITLVDVGLVAKQVMNAFQ